MQPETRPAPSLTHQVEELVVELVPAFASSQSETRHKGSQNIGPAALAQSESSDGQTHQPHTLTHAFWLLHSVVAPTPCGYAVLPISDPRPLIPVPVVPHSRLRQKS